ncbi:hypothetical protein [Desulfosporosinus sp.]|uniref:hypothetical protein n=1 Tax=Desulfosporosinus sp. TaxID=157907 RepID=UPI0025BB8290|nr:hypothetical protein [Desulfosporosinus sp.]MBC2721819.1 hypothetical protein [Desulfosporosinus sp.]MBC2726277.1 hypothetical protein [Desulfosporosinus sp.]
MHAKAIEKIRSEMTQNTANSYIQVVGGFLLQHLELHPQGAEKILAIDKTIAKSLEEMRKEASKKKVGNCAVLTDQEGFTVVLKYYGIEAAAPGPASNIPPQSIPKEAAVNPTAPSAPTATKPVDDFDIKLEDLLS